MSDAINKRVPNVPMAVEQKSEDGKYWHNCPLCEFPGEGKAIKSQIGQLPVCRACRKMYEVVNG